MAESRPEALSSTRWRDRAGALAATLALVTATAPGAPPVPPVVPAERTRLVRVRASTVPAARIPTRLRRWIRLLLAPRAIASAPTCRTDTPVLPTVGRPRDGPRARNARGAAGLA